MIGIKNLNHHPLNMKEAKMIVKKKRKNKIDEKIFNQIFYNNYILYI